MICFGVNSKGKKSRS